MTKIINLFAGPGAGKSTTAAGLFYFMKLKKYKCELITEYAKDLTYGKEFFKLSSPIHMLDQQYRRQLLPHKTVDYIITDSPIILPLVYAEKKHMLPEYTMLAFDHFNEFDNINFFIDRVKEYQKYGRNQTEEEARVVDTNVRGLLDHHKIKYTVIQGDENAPHKILREIEGGQLFNEANTGWPVGHPMRLKYYQTELG